MEELRPSHDLTISSSLGEGEPASKPAVSAHPNNVSNLQMNENTETNTPHLVQTDGSVVMAELIITPSGVEAGKGFSTLFNCK